MGECKNGLVQIAARLRSVWRASMGLWPTRGNEN